MPNESATLDGQVEQIVKNIGVPPCPAVLTKLVQAMREDDPDFSKIGRLIGGDVGLSATMLKTVNSPFYGLRTKATSVSQAVALLGLNNVSQLVTGLLLRGAFAGSDRRVMEEFWDSSSSIARITAWLTSKVRIVNRDDAYTFSLFRDCGTAALITAFKDYKPGTKAADPQQLLAAEKERYGANHAELGCQMAKNWLLPEATCEAVLHHHAYAGLISGEIEVPASSRGLIALALASEWVYAMHVSGKPCPEWPGAGEFALAQLGIAESDLEALLPDVDGVLLAG